MNVPATNPAPRLIVILGPTAGGKSELAVALAERLPGGGEVIGADSMQVYRHLDVGTAKPPPDDRARVPHHLIDLVEPTERFTVADWLERAEALIDGLLGRGRWPIVVGGTNLYLKALLEGMFEGPGADPAFRASLDAVPDAELHDRLRGIDPAAADRIAPADRKRIVRALEVHHVTGQPITQLQTQWRGDAQSPNPAADTRHPTYRRDPILIGLDWPTEAINRRINARVKTMFHPEAGGESLPDETRRLEAAGVLGPQAREALGTKQCLEYDDPDEAMERTKILTRRFAKQQRTWLKRFRDVHWIGAVPEDLERWTGRALEAIRGDSRPSPTG